MVKLSPRVSSRTPSACTLWLRDPGRRSQSELALGLPPWHFQCERHGVPDDIPSRTPLGRVPALRLLLNEREFLRVQQRPQDVFVGNFGIGRLLGKVCQRYLGMFRGRLAPVYPKEQLFNLLLIRA